MRNGNRLVCVQYKQGPQNVGQIPWEEAFEQEQKGKVRFISRTLYRAAKAGLDIDKIIQKGRQAREDDQAIKTRIKELGQTQKKAETKPEKTQDAEIKSQKWDRRNRK